MAGTYTRRINIWINGEKVSNDMKSIRAAAAKLRNEINLLEIGSDKYMRKTAQLKQLNKVIADHTASLRPVESGWKRLVGTLKNYMFTIAAVVGGGFSLSKLTEDFGKFEDSIKNLQSLTGLAGDKLQYLVDKAKDLSTSVTADGVRITQSAAEILDAFTLVGSQRPELLKNEEALAKVTEAALILANAGKMQLEPAARAITGAMNQMNLSADESERIINAFGSAAQIGAVGIEALTKYMERTGSISEAMNIPLESVLGMIEAVGPKFSLATEGSTQLKNVLLQLAAGADDTNPAVVGLSKALENLANKNLSINEINKEFGEGNVVAAKALIDNRLEVERYTTAITGTQTAVEMAAINTDTFNTKLQQSKNEMILAGIELGGKLAPAYLAGQRGLAGFVTGLAKTVGFLTDNWKLMVVLSAAILGYTVATKAAAIATSIKAAATWIATKAQMAWNAALAMNPIGAVVAGITAAAAILALYSNRLTEVGKKERDVANVRAEGEKSIARTKVELEQLWKIAESETKSLEARKRAIVEINRISPEYLGNITLETIRTDKAREAKEKFIAILSKEARAKAISNKLEEIEKEMLELEEGGEDGTMTWWDHLWDYFGDAAFLKYDKLMNELKARKTNLQNLLLNDDELVSALLGPGTGTGTDTSTGTSTGTTTPEKYSMSSDENFIRQSLALKEQLLSGLIASEDEYNQKLLQLQITFLEARIAREVDTGDALLDIQSQLADKRIQLHRSENDRLDALAKEGETPLEKAEREYKERLVALGLFQRDKRDMTEVELKALEALEEGHRLNIAKIENENFRDMYDSRANEFNRGLTEMQFNHAREMAAFRGNTFEKEQLRQQLQQKERDFQREHFESLLHDLKALLNEGNFENIDLSQILLSDESTEEIKEKIRSVMQELTDLLGLAPIQGAGNGGVPYQEFDIFGYTESDWEKLMENLKAGEIGLNQIQMAIRALGNAWNDINQIISNSEKARLQEAEETHRTQMDNLETRLKAGYISEEYYNSQRQKLDADLEKKRAQAAYREARREKNVALMSAIINASLAVIKSLPNPVLAAIVAAAGAIQVGIIASTPLPDVPGKEEGGFLDVTREGDERKFRALYAPGKRGWIHRPTVITGEGGSEYVIPNEGIKNPYIGAMVAQIEAARRAGTLASLNPSVFESIRATRLPAMAGGGFSDTSIKREIRAGGSAPSNDNNTLTKIDKTLDKLNDTLKSGIRSTVALTGRGSIHEAEERYKKLIDNANF